MANADDIIDRQRLRRSLGIWRVAAILALIALVAASAMRFVGLDTGATGKSRDHIARIAVEGTIIGDEDLLDRLDRIAKSERVKGVIVTVSSPGGTTVGGEAIYEAIRRIGEDTPVVAQVGTLAASAGYMIAAASDHIVARQTSIVGSIGVIFQYPNIEELLTNLGIDVRAIKSSPLKAEPNFYGEPPQEAEEVIEAMIMDSYRWFRDLVAKRRDFTPAEIEAVADGSVYTGRQAIENGLVDALGGDEVVLDWLEEQGVSRDLPIVDWEPEPDPARFLLMSRLAAPLLARIGIDLSNGRPVMLDGLVSVWHGPR